MVREETNGLRLVLCRPDRCIKRSDHVLLLRPGTSFPILLFHGNFHDFMFRKGKKVVDRTGQPVLHENFKREIISSGNPSPMRVPFTLRSVRGPRGREVGVRLRTTARLDVVYQPGLP